MLSHIISLLLFGVATSFSPGPNNIMTAYTMFNFGFKKTIPTILGVITGWTVLIIVLQLGSSAVFQKIDNFSQCHNPFCGETACQQTNGFVLKTVMLVPFALRRAFNQTCYIY